MRNMRNLALASVSLWAIAVPAFAQDAPAEEGAIDGNEIIVSARRREESIQDVPQVVNAVTADTISKLNLRKFEDIASVVPGLQLTPNANGIGSVTTIRGVNFDVNQSGNNGTVQFYYNDAPLSSNVLLQAMYDIGQIEVQRGPQGTLRGKASPSGSIAVTMRRPDLSEAGGKMEATFTSLDGWNVNGALNIPIIDGKLGVRVAGLAADDNGNRVKPLSGARQDLRNETNSGRFSVRANPFDDVLLLDFNYQTLSKRGTFYAQLESVNQYGPTSGAAASPVTIRARDRATRWGLASTANQDFRIYNWQGQLRLYDQRLTYIGLTLKQHFAAFAPSDTARIFANPTAPVQLLGGTPGAVGQFGQPTDTRSSDTSHEVRLQNEERVAGMFDYVVGFLRYKGFSNTAFQQVVGAIASPAPPATNTLSLIIRLPLQRYAGFREESIFGNLTAHIGDSTEVSGGVRRINYKINSGLINNGVDQAALRVNETRKAWIYTASVKHNFTEDLMVYGSFGTSWRPNTLIIGGPPQPTAFQRQYLGTPPEKSKSWEIGTKSTWLDGRLDFNLTGYWQKYTNYPYRSPGVNGIAYYNALTNQIATTPFVTAAKAEVKGIEAELAFRPLNGLSIGAVLSYADGKIKNADLPCLDMNSDNVPDVVTTLPTVAEYGAVVPLSQGLDTCTTTIRANNASPWGATVQSEYSLPVSDGMDGYLRGLWTWKGNSQGDPANAFDQVKSYSILNLYGGLRDPDGGWEVAFYGKNITNTFRVLTRTNGPERTVLSAPIGPQTFTNYYGITVTEPREFGVNVRIAFGSR